MKKNITILILVILFDNVSFANKALAVEVNDIKSLVRGNEDFALDLYGSLKDNPNAISSKGNLFFSPYSISTALAIVYGGARGQTKEQMAKALHFTLPVNNLHSSFGSLQKQLLQNDKSHGYQLLLANSLWGQKGEPFLKEFLDMTKDYYDAGVNQLDYANEPEQSRKIINSWVEEKTKYKIKDVIPSGGIDQDTVLVLTNAIYFKGEWKIKFSRWKTKEADFTISPNNKVSIPLMHLKEKFNYCEDANQQVLELPYKSDEISMLVILPRDLNGLKEIEKTLSAENLKIILSNMRTREIEIYFPRFIITWGTFSLNNTLKALGMSDAFNSDKADFSGMNDKGGIWISDVLHKAFIEVNEKGTEASAATGVVLTQSINFETPVFRPDHPFIFIIKDNRSGSILFMGRLMNPAE